MANSSNRKKSYNSNRRKSGTRAKNAQIKARKQHMEESVMSDEAIIVIALILCVFLFCCPMHLIGSFGEYIAMGMFGLLGRAAYAFPILLFIGIAFGVINRGSGVARIKQFSGWLLYFLISLLLEMFDGIVPSLEAYDIAALWKNGMTERTGGGVLAGSVAYLMNHYLDKAGTMLITIVLIIVCILLITGRSLIDFIKEGSLNTFNTAREDVTDYRRQVAEDRMKVRTMREERMERMNKAESETQAEDNLPRYAKKRKGIGIGIGSEKPVAENVEEYSGEILEEIDKTPRRNKKVSGVMADTSIKPAGKGTSRRDDIHEITVDDIKDSPIERMSAVSTGSFDKMAEVHFHGISDDAEAVTSKTDFDELSGVTFGNGGAEEIHKEDNLNNSHRVSARVDHSFDGMDEATKSVAKTIAKNKTHKKYIPPKLSLLNAPSANKGGSSKEELMATAKLLQDTLLTFGVNAKVTDISQGPSVTRFELQPEVGVRVSKIVSLSDDLKLSLAATDIRIEAPIPGKSAVGIEIPNKVSSGVAFRELLEDKEFKNFDSKLAFAVGKDISGKVIVTDIAKMPHMLIAGATGSGKSVCINTIIMSILYKASPDDVKLIMIDPKVVELSVYNGIPHLLIPVVTDPKKAAAALGWGVKEMTDRFQKFAEFKVRDIKGYNKAVENGAVDSEGNPLEKMPQIVIIVDELADLMMVAAKEVEESICRIAQLARACGIHLVIATQRPSVDVITGLIKANMPSRVAFAVSSGVDSRTILDMVGAEKLLGKGDMLFYPQGYTKPARVQGAFISDSEVGNVVDFLKEQGYDDSGDDKIISMINSGAASGAGSYGNVADDRDELFAMAGEFIINSGKASIGGLQRKFKIGFNRAARIMDQLCEAGVVGAESGTKPREILMSPEQFESYVEEYV